MRTDCAAHYGLIRMTRRSVVCAPIVIAPHITFGQGMIACALPPRVLPCPGCDCSCMLEQDLTVRVPFCWDARVNCGPVCIECRPCARNGQ